MKYPNITQAVFSERPNRFIAHVQIGERQETVHVKNTGRCRELLIPGARVALTRSDNPARKTAYDLVAVFKDGPGWINIDSSAPNSVAAEWLASSPAIFPHITYVKPEYTFGRSRVDFYVKCDSEKILLEVKGCTLEEGGIGLFPDAPTERGVKHLKELTAAVASGYTCYLAFVIAIPHVHTVLPNNATHPAFGTALAEALAAGVKMLYLPCTVTPGELAVAPKNVQILTHIPTL